MEEQKSRSRNGGVSFPGLLTIAFIVLRLCGVIAWPWLWVLAPLWVYLLLLLIGGIVLALFRTE